MDELVHYFRSFMKMRAAFLRLHSPLAVRGSPAQDPVGPSLPARGSRSQKTAQKDPTGTWTSNHTASSAK